jgi:hypothetical protein
MPEPMYIIINSEVAGETYDPRIVYLVNALIQMHKDNDVKSRTCIIGPIMVVKTEYSIGVINNSAM